MGGMAREGLNAGWEEAVFRGLRTEEKPVQRVENKNKNVPPDISLFRISN